MSLVPELLVTDLEASLAFWCGLCGFTVAYERRDEGFAYLTRGAAHVMLEQAGVGRNWLTGALDHPRGRGVNFQIAVDDLDPILANLKAAKHKPFMAPETRYYRSATKTTACASSSSPTPTATCCASSSRFRASAVPRRGRRALVRLPLGRCRSASMPAGLGETGRGTGTRRQARCPARSALR